MGEKCNACNNNIVWSGLGMSQGELESSLKHYSMISVPRMVIFPFLNKIFSSHTVWARCCPRVGHNSSQA